MKGVSAKSRKNLNQMLKQVQHDNRVRVSFFCHPELVSGSRFLVLRVWVLKPRPVGGVVYFISDLLYKYRHRNPPKIYETEFEIRNTKSMILSPSLLPSPLWGEGRVRGALF